MDREGWGELLSALRKNRWIWLLLAAGLVLLLLPGTSARGKEAESAATPEEERLADALRRMEGVGDAVVLLAEGPGRNDGFTGAVVVCAGAEDPRVRLRIVETVSAFTGLGSHRIIVQKMSS